MNNNSIKNFSFVGFGRLSAIILQAVFYLIFAALLEPEEYGQLGVIVALAGTFSVFSVFGLNNTIVVYHSKEKIDLIQKINTLAFIGSCIAAVVLLTVNQFAAVLALATSFFVMSQANLLGLKQYKKRMMMAIIKNSLTIIIPISLYFILEIPGIVLGLAISNFIASTDFWRNLKFTSFFDLKKQSKVIMHNFGIETARSLPPVVDKLLIAPLFGFYIVGIYQFNLQILLALQFLPTILYSFLLSEESSGIGHKKITILVIVATTLMSIIAIFLAPYFVNQFYPKYFEGVSSLQILLLSIIPLSITSVLSAKLQAKESTKIGYSAIVRIGTLLILIAVLGGFYELMGLSLAVLLSTSIDTAFLYFLFKKS